MEKRSWKMTNAGAITAGSYWYPFSETGAPTIKDIEDLFPCRSFTVENKSSQSMKIILDPICGSSQKEFDLPDGKTLSIDNRDLISYYQIAMLHQGLVDTGASEINVTVRNY